MNDVARSTEADPNTSLVYEVLFEVSDVETLGKLKWDLFRVESLLRAAPTADARHAIEQIDEEGVLAEYRARFVRDAERLNFDELVGFYDIALRVRENLHEAYVHYLRHVYTTLEEKLTAVDVDGVVRGADSVEGGVKETAPRRTRAFIVHTKKSTREVFAEVEFMDWSRLIAWHEERIPRVAALLSEAKLVYAHKRLAEQSVKITTEVRNLVRVVALIAGLAAVAATVAAILFAVSL